MNKIFYLLVGLLFAGLIILFVFMVKPSLPVSIVTQQNSLPSVPSNPSSGAHKSFTIDIKNFVFTPSTIIVGDGDTITWVNDDSSSHTVTADDGSFDSSSLSLRKSYVHSFNAKGTFTHHC